MAADHALLATFNKLGLNQWRIANAHAFGQLAAFIQQRIRYVYRRQRPTPLPSRTAKSRHQSQLGVDGLDDRACAERRSAARRQHFTSLDAVDCVCLGNGEQQKVIVGSVLVPLATFASIVTDISTLTLYR
jgi:hypothetical protein